MTRPPDSSSLMIQTDIAVVCRIDQDEWKNNIGVGLEGVRRLVEGYKAAGIPVREVHVSAVVHDDATYWMLKDGPYQTLTKKDQKNPNQTLVQQLIDLGVSVEVCGRSMAEHGWTAEDILPGVKIVADAYPRIADLQLQGYAYLRF
jgi:intracellular sulfur oxidation DsrE/DsrF family protein